jgi:hypothetical protein
MIADLPDAHAAAVGARKKMSLAPESILSSLPTTLAIVMCPRRDCRPAWTPRDTVPLDTSIYPFQVIPRWPLLSFNQPLTGASPHDFLPRMTLANCPDCFATFLDF